MIKPDIDEKEISSYRGLTAVSQAKYRAVLDPAIKSQDDGVQS